jgi:hypothetical protein
MSRRKRKAHPGPKSQTDATHRFAFLTGRAIILAIGIGALGAAGLVYYLVGPGRATQGVPAPVAAGRSGPTAAVPAVTFQPLRGRWLRPDGGYVIEIRDVDAAGALTAAYLNPQPIKVAKAEASLAGGTIRVFLELRDVGYPGSTYTLTYDPGSDQFKGTYFQAALRQTYDVMFVRLK